LLKCKKWTHETIAEEPHVVESSNWHCQTCRRGKSGTCIRVYYVLDRVHAYGDHARGWWSQVRKNKSVLAKQTCAVRSVAWNLGGTCSFATTQRVETPYSVILCSTNIIATKYFRQMIIKQHKRGG
jgi:hypothetical protein